VTNEGLTVKAQGSRGYGTRTGIPGADVSQIAIKKTQLDLGKVLGKCDCK